MQGKKRKAKERRRSISYSLSECVVRNIDEIESTSPRSVVVEQLLIEALKARKRSGMALIVGLTEEELTSISYLCTRGQTPEEHFRAYVEKLVIRGEMAKEEQNDV